MNITRRSPMSGQFSTLDLPVTPQQMAELGSRCIQDILPDLAPWQREFIKSGYTEAEQAELFAPPVEKACVVAFGDAFNGLRFVGPFDDYDAASEYGEEHRGDDEEYHIVELETP